MSVDAGGHGTGGDAAVAPRPPSAAVAVQDFSTAARTALRDLQRRFGMESWLLARRRGEEYVVIATADDDDPFGGRVGLVRRWDETFCARMVDGSAPMVAPVVDDAPAYAQMRAVTGLDPGSYLTVPVEGPDGELLGALCAAGRDPRGPELEAALPSVRVHAALLGLLLSYEVSLEREVRRAERAEAAAATDALTGAASRRAWDAAVAAEESRARRHGTPAGVLVVDLDGLKAVNDGEGHDAGDALLRRTAEVVREHVRGGDLLARLGGDEFGVLLVEAPWPVVEERARVLREALAAHGVEASVGAGAHEGDGDLCAAWRAADARMYAEKALRRSAAATRAPALPRPRPPAAPAPVSGVDALLDLVRAQLGMDAAFVSRREGERVVYRHVSAGDPALLQPGDSEPFDGTYCRLVVARELEEVVPDTAAHPTTAAMRGTRAGIGAYVGVPLHRGDGSLYGTLCTVSRSSRRELRPRDAEVLRSLGPVLVGLLQEEERAEGTHSRVVADLDALEAAGGPATALQGIVDLGTGRVVGAEALARFPAPGSAPGPWFSRAERAGEAERLDLLCLRSALGHVERVAGHLSVNASPRTVLSPAFADLLEEATGRGRLDGLAVEITEHEPVDDYAALAAALAPLRERGLAVAVDDAGAGFASMRHVVQLAPDVVKIDMSIVRDVHRSLGASAMAAALVGFARRTGAHTVAEGVETAEELDHLVGLGVDMAQGHLLARPVPATAWEPVAQG
ncbi:EAL domain-containing protein [Pseudokineococcus marinus]|uniref:EAL domain-containing protein n=1 Tax=Pseudokineococcus marinus TaxID=351215 RepID=A0A849BNY0_9ACTN|nr:EAL domain-containing protein [Pseudokineococcus marinus]NNH22532.1 EAL domain-containing protein [Pseudokineococcus marinus]